MENREEDNINHMDETLDEEWFLERMRNSEMFLMMNREKFEERNLAQGKKANIFTTFGSKFFGTSPNPLDETLFNPASCLSVSMTHSCIPAQMKPLVLEKNTMYQQRKEATISRVERIWLLDEKMNQKSDDEGFLEKMQDSETIRIMGREKFQKRNVFTKFGAKFFGKSDALFDETIFNPFFSLLVSVDSKWITARKPRSPENEDMETVADQDSDGEEAKMDAGDVDINFNSLNVQMDNKDASDEEKKTLKRKTEDDNEGCKDAKRRHDEA